MGCDISSLFCGAKISVSIHAPTWDATSCRFVSSYDVMFQSTHPHGMRQRGLFGADIARRFNPRTHMGCDAVDMASFMKTDLFQSTHPHGMRLKHTYSYYLLRRFNPRTHMGCDPIQRRSATFSVVSIHAPTWDATQSFSPDPRYFHVSIHAPTWDATQRAVCFQDNNNVSIHAPTWDATQ